MPGMDWGKVKRVNPGNQMWITKKPVVEPVRLMGLKAEGCGEAKALA